MQNTQLRSAARSALKNMRAGVASLLTVSLLGGLLLAAPSSASAATTTSDVVPFNAAQAERYAEVAQFGADAPGSDPKRTGYDSQLDGATSIFTRERGSNAPGSGAVVLRTWEGPQAGDFSTTELQTPAAARGFGYSVDIDEEAGIAVVGARFSQEVYVYTRTGATWSTKPTRVTPRADARVTQVRSFGESVSLSGSHLVVGAPNSRVDGKVNAGAAYAAPVASVLGADAEATALLLPAGNVNVDDVYGQVVEARGTTAVIAATQHQEVAGDGNRYQVGQISAWNLADSSHTFTVAPDVNQAQVDFPPALEGGSWAGLGRSLAITEDGRVIAGSPSEVSYPGSKPGDIAKDTETTQGAVYVYNGDGTFAGKTLSAHPHQYYFASSLDYNDATSELFVGALNLDGKPNTGTVQIFDVAAPALGTAARPLSTLKGGESMFGTSGILGGTVRAATATDAQGVERHRVAVSARGNVYMFAAVDAVTLTKVSSLAPGNASPSAIQGRNQAEYTVSVKNTSGIALKDFTVTDDLSGVLDDASVSGVKASSGAAQRSGDLITWTGDLAVNEVVTISYRVEVMPEVVADDDHIQNFTEPVAALVNTVQTTRLVKGQSVSVPNVRQESDAPDRDKWTNGVTVTTPIDGALKLAKTVKDEDGNGHASPGERVSYAISARNVGGLTIPGAVVEDDLSEVLAYATGPENVQVSFKDRDGKTISASAPVFSDPSLTWTGDFPAGATLTVTYDVVVKDAKDLYPLAGGESLKNGVDSPSNVVPEGPETTIPVEDELLLAKTAAPSTGSEVKPGDTIEYTLTLTNKDATVAKQGVTVTDDLSAVLPFAELQGKPSNGATVSGNTLTWKGDVPAGGTVTITYTVKVRDDAPDGQKIGNHVSSAQVRENPPGTEHKVENPRGTVDLAKSSTPASGTQVKPGQTVTYEVTAQNDTALDMPDVEITDVVSGPVTVNVASLPTGAVLNGTTITWTGTVPAKGKVTLSYEVTVNADAAAPAVVGNVVTSPDMENDPKDPPKTEHPVRTIELEKTSTPASGSTVKSGDEITYTVRAKNPSAVDFSNVTVTDDLSGVLNNAKLVQPVLPGIFDPAAQTISWSADIPAGQSVAFTYRVIVNDVIAPEGAVLRNVVTSPDSPTSPETEHPTDNPRGKVTLAKSSVPASGATVRPGDRITYTVTAVNDTPRVVRDVRIVDDVTNVLANATIDTKTLPTGMTLSGNELTWVGDVAGNSTVELVYTAQVKADAEAPAVIGNVVTSTDMTNDPKDPPTTEHPVGTVVLAKSSTPVSGTAVKAGDTVGYRLTITNGANAPLAGVVVTDDLSKVLDRATLESGPTNGATVNKETLTWKGDLAAGETVTIDYSVRVNDGVFDGAIRNMVSSPDAPTSPETEHPVGSVALKKSTSVPSGTAVNRGDEITYTVQVSNSSGVDVTGAAVTDDLSQVLQNAQIVAGSLNVVGGGTAEMRGSTLHWTGDVADGATVTITYTARVNDDAPAGASLRNVVTSPFSPDKPTTETPVGTVNLSKKSTVSPAGPAKPGSEITYTVKVHNKSAVAVRGAEVHDDLSDVLAHAAMVTEPTATSGKVTRNDAHLQWVGDLAAGEEASITYVVRVNNHVTPPVVLRNVVTSPDSPDKPTTENPIGTLNLSKSTDVPAGSTVRIGDTVTYTVKIANSSGADMAGVTVSDDLSDVLDNATMQGAPEIVSGGGTLELKHTTLTWSGDVADGATVELRYTVKVNDDVQGHQSLRNVVTSPDSPSVPETENPIGSVELSKTSQPATGSGVKPGDTITYRVSVRNTSAVEMTGVTATDDLSKVLPYATMQGNPRVVSGGGTATFDAKAQTVTWTGDLAAAQEAVMEYTVLVKADAGAGKLIRNHVSSPDSPDIPTTEHEVTAITLEKAVSPVSGSTVRPGEDVTYTITATNGGSVDATQVHIEDDLSDVLDDATLKQQDISVSDGTTATLTGSTLSWNGTVPARGKIVITYTVKVKGDALAPSTLRNLVTSPHSPDQPQTENPVGSLLLAKVNDKGDGTVVKPGEVVTYTVTITNPSSAKLEGATVTDDLSDVLSEATWNDDAVASTGTVKLDGTTMRWTGTAPAKGAVTVTYSVTVKDTAEAPAAIRNAVMSPDSPTTPSVENPVGTVNLAKSSTPASGKTVKPGENVTYRVTVTNPSKADQHSVRVTDNLTDVLSSATLVGTPQVSDGSSATVTGNTLNWVGTVPARGKIDITYEVRVNDDAVAPAVLRNLVTSPESTDIPETENPVGTVVLSKVPDVGNGTAVKPGDTVTYTVKVENPVDAAVSGVSVTDDLSGVLTSADLVAGPTADSGTATFDGATQSIKWSGDLAAKQVVEITYSVKVKQSAAQGDVLRNRVVSPDSPNIPETENPVGDLTATKRLLDSDGKPVGTGTVVAPGQTLTYELTATNGLTRPERVALSDDLSEVLNSATIVTAPAATWTAPGTVPSVDFDGTTVDWAHDLPAGATVKITYTVKTDPKSDGTRVLKNTLKVNGTDGPGTENPIGTLRLSKSVNPASGSAVKPGADVTYTVTAENTSSVDIDGAAITDDLSDVLDNAKLQGEVVVSDGSKATIDGGAQLTWAGKIAANSKVTLTYTVRVNADAVAPAVLRNLVTSPNSPDVPETENPVGTVSLEKTSVPGNGAAVKPGDEVTYRVAIRNSTSAPISGVSVTDDLADVVDNATLKAGSVTVSDGSSATVSANRISWTGDVPAHSEVVVSYVVTVNKDATAPQVLRNVVTSPDSPDKPEVTNPVGTLRLAKSSLPGSGSTVKPGDTVSYTVRIANDATAPVTGARVTDDLSDVLNNATVIGTPQASSGSVALQGTRLEWAGDVPALSEVTLTYAVRVNDDAVAPAVLRNLVSSPDSPNVPETENPIATVQLKKSSNPTSGVAVKPGDTVEYIISVTNPGAVDLDNVYVEDNLSDILDDAALIGAPKVSDGSKAHINGKSLSWTGKVPAGETVSITYSVLVSETAVAPATLRNLVTSPHSPDIPETVNPVGSVQLEKSSDPQSGSSVARGDKVTYTVTITNPTPYALDGVTVSDDLSDVLDDATLVGDISAPVGTTATVTGKTLRWTGPVPALSSVQLQYTVQVNEDAAAPASLKNLVLSPHSPDQPVTENPVAPLEPGEILTHTGAQFAPFLIGLALLALLSGAVVLLVRNQRFRQEEVDNA